MLRPVTGPLWFRLDRRLDAAVDRSGLAVGLVRMEGELAALSASVKAHAAEAAAGQAALATTVGALEQPLSATGDSVAGLAAQLERMSRELVHLRSASGRAEAALREQAAQLALLTDSVCDAIRPRS